MMTGEGDIVGEFWHSRRTAAVEAVEELLAKGLGWPKTIAEAIDRVTLETEGDWLGLLDAVRSNQIRRRDYEYIVARFGDWRQARAEIDLWCERRAAERNAKGVNHGS